MVTVRRPLVHVPRRHHLEAQPCPSLAGTAPAFAQER